MTSTLSSCSRIISPPRPSYKLPPHCCERSGLRTPQRHPWNGVSQSSPQALRIDSLGSAFSPIDASTALGLVPDLTPLTCRVTWYDNTGKSWRSSYKRSIVTSRGLFYPRSTAPSLIHRSRKRTTALHVAPNDAVKVTGLQKRARRCYTWGSRVEAKLA